MLCELWWMLIGFECDEYDLMSYYWMIVDSCGYLMVIGCFYIIFDCEG